MTHRKGERRVTNRVERARSGTRLLVIVGRKGVHSTRLGPRPHPVGCKCPFHEGHN